MFLLNHCVQAVVDLATYFHKAMWNLCILVLKGVRAQVYYQAHQVAVWAEAFQQATFPTQHQEGMQGSRATFQTMEVAAWTSVRLRHIATFAIRNLFDMADCSSAITWLRQKRLRWDIFDIFTHLWSRMVCQIIQELMRDVCFLFWWVHTFTCCDIAWGLNMIIRHSWLHYLTFWYIYMFICIYVYIYIYIFKNKKRIVSIQLFAPCQITKKKWKVQAWPTGFLGVPLGKLGHTSAGLPCPFWMRVSTKLQTTYQL